MGPEILLPQSEQKYSFLNCLKSRAFFLVILHCENFNRFSSAFDISLTEADAINSYILLNCSQMKTYSEKRDFRKTSEPKNGNYKNRSDKPIFVVQKHDATNLHYDFRLEIDGTLKSWSVPKGPSTSSITKRMAIPTEDHPLAYADFEGNIPEGEYGGGTVMVWDRGELESIKKDEEGKLLTLEESYEMGSLEIRLFGKKLKGGYNLIRMKGGKMRGNWLLVKQEDEFADARKNPVEKQQKSVITGRSLEEIAEAENEKRKK